MIGKTMISGVPQRHVLQPLLYIRNLDWNVGDKVNKFPHDMNICAVDRRVVSRYPLVYRGKERHTLYKLQLGQNI